MSDDREKLSFAERDKLRRTPRSEREARPRGREARERAAAEARGALAQADALFSRDEGGSEGAALARAVRDAHGSAELEPACRAYVEALGAPAAADLISIFLDAAAPDLIRIALESLESRVAAAKLELTGGLRTQLRTLALHADDHIAGICEDLLA